MKFSTRRLSLILSFVTAGCFAAGPAVALVPQQFTFVQDGYSEGASVTGGFSGVDLDGNGILVHFPEAAGGPAIPIEVLELTAFSMHFSGNSLAPGFELSLDDLYGFVYELGTDGIGDDPAYDPTLDVNITEGIGAIGALRFYTSGLGPNGFIGGYVGGQIEVPSPSELEENALDASPNLVHVTEVPEPAASSMLIIVGLVATACRRRW